MADPALKASFIDYCNGGKTTATTMDVTKLFRNADVFEKNVTSNDLDIAFSKVKTKGQREINYEQFVQLLRELKFKDPEASRAKLAAANKAKTTGVTKTSKTGGVDRLTDTSKYTGSHRERFDESGKGKGLEGRVERDEKASEGYVGGYKGQDTYDKKH